MKESNVPLSLVPGLHYKAGGVLQGAFHDPGHCWNRTGWYPGKQRSQINKFDCLVARQNFSLLATVHDQETVL